jgi:ubiquinone/menaquinone biosynthesis C-methylase UbiE
MNDFIKDFWDSKAEKHHENCEASWEDRFAINLEVETLSKNIPDGQHVLNVGCANGYSFFLQFARNKMYKAVGIDFSEPMIKEAQIQIDQKDLQNIEVKVANIKDLPFEDGYFDVVYTTRVLINLHNWEDQLKGIKECLRVTRKGGIVIFMEAFWEPLVKLNSLRSICNLAPLVEHDFNRYLKKDRLEKFLNDNELSWECQKFSSVYYLGTRLLRDLIPDVDRDYTSDFNKEFYKLEQKYSGGDFGVQEVYVIER